ncbi:hypothetical protein Tco_1386377 [Tanacetum coccineum]
MNWILLGIPRDIYNFVDVCQTAEQMWKRVKRLMQGTDLSLQKRHSRLMNEFEKFSAEAGESLDSNELDVNASIAKQAARNHNPLTLVANAYASPLSSRSSQQYYVTHPPLVHDYDDDYQGEIQGDEPEDRLSTAMILLAYAITQHFSSPMNNHLRTSSNTRNQAYVQDGRVDIQGKSSGYVESSSRNVERNIRNQGRNVGNQGITAGNEYVLMMRKNDFMLMSANGDDQLEELNALVIMMAHLQPTDYDSNAEPKYDSDFVNDVNDSQI